MLRIKKEVKRKQLEDLGFTYYNGWLYKTYSIIEYKSSVNNETLKLHPQLDYVEVRIWRNKHLYFNYVYDDEFIENKGYWFRKQDYDYGLDIIFDLIQANLVEKVSEGENE